MRVPRSKRAEQTPSPAAETEGHQILIMIHRLVHDQRGWSRRELQDACVYLRDRSEVVP